MIEEGSERLLAHGTSRLTIFPPLDPPPDPPSDLEPFEPPEHETPDPYLRPAPDGVIEQEVWDELPGAEILRRQLAGELPPPPLHHLTGLRPGRDRRGHGDRGACPAREWLASPTGRLQGGAIAMLADFAMLIAVETTTPPGLAFAGLDLKANFLRPVSPDESELTARAEVVHAGRTIAITRATVTNAEGKPVLLATGSSIYLPGRPASLGEVELSGREDAEERSDERSVAHRREVEAVRGRRLAGALARGAAKQGLEVLGAAPAARHLEHRPHQDPDHVAHEGVGLDPELEQLAREWLREPVRPPLGAGSPRARSARARSAVGVKAVKSCLPTSAAAQRSSASRSTRCGHHSARPISSGCRTGEASTR